MCAHNLPKGVTREAPKSRARDKSRRPRPRRRRNLNEVGLQRNGGGSDIRALCWKGKARQLFLLMQWPQTGCRVLRSCRCLGQAAILRSALISDFFVLDPAQRPSFLGSRPVSAKVDRTSSGQEERRMVHILFASLAANETWRQTILRMRHAHRSAKS